MPTQAHITNINPAMMTMSKTLMFANMSKAILLQFQPPKITKQEANKLKTNPRAIINSEDNKKYCSLSGWLKNNTFDDIVVICRKTGLMMELASDRPDNILLLPFKKNSIKARFTYTHNEQRFTRTLTAHIDHNKKKLKLTLAFNDDANGHMLYGEITDALSTHPGISIHLECIHEYMTKRPLVFTRHFAVMQPVLGKLKVKKKKSPAPKHFNNNAAMRMTMNKPMHMVTAHHVLATKKLKKKGKKIPPKKPKPGNQTQPKQPEYIRAVTAKISLNKPRLFRERIDENVFPDLLRLEQNGWGNIEGAHNRRLHYTDTPFMDLFHYLPTEFRLGYYTDQDGKAPSPPISVKHYVETGVYRVSVTLTLLPYISNEDRFRLKDYLQSVLLKNLLPRIRIKPASGIQTTFSPEFSAGEAGNEQHLPENINISIPVQDADDKIIIKYDMEASVYPIFVELLKAGKHGSVQMKTEGVEETAPVRIDLENIITNAVQIQSSIISEVVHMDNNNLVIDSPTICKININNLLSFPVTITALDLDFVHKADLPGMIFEAESHRLIQDAGQILGSKTGDQHSKLYEVTPLHITQLDVAETNLGIVNVDGGHTDDWLDRVHRDPSLQPEGFTINVTPVGGDNAQITFIHIRLYKQGETEPRYSEKQLPTAAFSLPVKMTLEELSGENGFAPRFYLEWETQYQDGGRSLPQYKRISVDDNIHLSQDGMILPLVNQSTSGKYHIFYRKNGQDFQESGSQTEIQNIIDELKPQNITWDIAIHHEELTEPDQEEGTDKPDNTPATETIAPVTGPKIEIITDLLPMAFDSSTLQTVLVMLSNGSGDLRGSFVLDKDHHNKQSWQPGTDTIPPFKYKITFIYSDAVPVILEGRETNPILIIDVPNA